MHFVNLFDACFHYFSHFVLSVCVSAVAHAFSRPVALLGGLSGGLFPWPRAHAAVAQDPHPTAGN